MELEKKKLNWKYIKIKGLKKLNFKTKLYIG